MIKPNIQSVCLFSFFLLKKNKKTNRHRDRFTDQERKQLAGVLKSTKQFMDLSRALEHQAALITEVID